MEKRTHDDVYQEMTELLEEILSALENCVLHAGKPMPEIDKHTRMKLVDKARKLVEETKTVQY